MIRMVTVQTQFIFQNCIEPEGTFSQTGSHILCDLSFDPLKLEHEMSAITVAGALICLICTSCEHVSFDTNIGSVLVIIYTLTVNI